MNIELNLSLDEIRNLNSNIDDSKDSILLLLSKTSSQVDELSQNITGTQIQQIISGIDDKLQAIRTNMSTSFDTLISFLNKQMSQYEGSYESAEKMLEYAFSFIESNVTSSFV